MPYPVSSFKLSQQWHIQSTLCPEARLTPYAPSASSPPSPRSLTCLPVMPGSIVEPYRAKGGGWAETVSLFQQQGTPSHQVLCTQAPSPLPNGRSATVLQGKYHSGIHLHHCLFTLLWFIILLAHMPFILNHPFPKPNFTPKLRVILKSVDSLWE